MTTSIIQTAIKTISSIELVFLINENRSDGSAELRHDNFMAKIERHPGIDSPKFLGQYKDGSGRMCKCYHLPKREAELMVMSESLVVQTKVYDMLVASELSLPTVIPPTYSAALRLAADQAEIIEQQKAELEAAAPAIQFVEKYVDSTGLKSFRQVCKLLNAKENDFRTFLMARQIMYRLGGEWTPYAHHVDAGRFVVKAGTAESGHAFNSAKFTAKGVEWVAGEFAKFQLYALEAA